MRSNLFTATLSALKLPVKLLVGWVRNKRPEKVKNERKEKQLKHVRNFAPTHYSWQRSIGKYPKKKSNDKKKNKISPAVQLTTKILLAKTIIANWDKASEQEKKDIEQWWKKTN